MSELQTKQCLENLKQGDVGYWSDVGMGVYRGEITPEEAINALYHCLSKLRDEYQAHVNRITQQNETNKLKPFLKYWENKLDQVVRTLECIENNQPVIFNGYYIFFEDKSVLK